MICVRYIIVMFIFSFTDFFFYRKRGGKKGKSLYVMVVEGRMKFLRY